MGGNRGDGEGGEPLASGLVLFVGVPLSPGLAMLANLANGLFASPVGGVVRGVVVRD